MDLKDLTQEQLNQIAVRLVDNQTLISRAKNYALRYFSSYAKEYENYSPSPAFMHSLEEDDLVITDEEPKVFINTQTVSAPGNIRIEVMWQGVFEIKDSILQENDFGLRKSMRGEGRMDQDEMVELIGEDLFYFEDNESHSEE